MEKIQRAGGAHCSAMEQQAKDLARQVAVLVNEVQRLKSGRTSAALPAADPVGPQNAQAVITTHLLDFRDVQVLLLSLQNAAATLMAHLAPGSPSTSCSCAHHPSDQLHTIPRLAGCPSGPSSFPVRRMHAGH